MPEIPRDPRQLARDILAGRVSLEDLAREQARRRGEAVQAPAPAAPRPPVIKQQPQIPIARAQAPLPIPPRPTPPRPQQQQRRQPPRPQQQQQRRGPIIQNPAPQTRREPQAVVPLPDLPSAPKISEQATKSKSARKSPVELLLNTKSAMRRAILVSEVLNKPLSIRNDPF